MLYFAFPKTNSGIEEVLDNFNRFRKQKKENQVLLKVLDNSLNKICNILRKRLLIKQIKP